MHRHPAFRVDDPFALLRDLSATVPATLVTSGPEGLTSTIVPMLVDMAPRDDGATGCLIGHVAKANRDVTSAAGREALAVFTGPQGYISPSWYPSKADHGEVVPTWDYVTVQVAGTIVLHEDPAWLLALVTRLTDHHEASSATPWRVSDAPEPFVESMLAGIVGVEIAIQRVDAKAKLSQNRSTEDIEGVVAGLAPVDPRLATAVRTARP